MNKRYPMLLFPCFRLQDRMQKSTLGESHWLQLQKRLYQKLKLENYQVRPWLCQMLQTIVAHLLTLPPIDLKWL